MNKSKIEVRKKFHLVLISGMVLSLVLGSNSFVFAQVIPFTTTTDQTTFFTKVSVDTAPVPNKPFKITAYVQTQNAGDLITSISAPAGISVLSPVISSLGYTNQQNTVQTSWTLMAGQPGSYSITLSAHSNFPVQDVTYVVNVNVGTPNSLVVTAVNVPGNIYPSDSFTVGLTLQNTGSIDDNNIMASISVPDGLHLVSDVNENYPSLSVNGVHTFNWKVIAQSSGSYTITFLYSSTNSGSNSVDANVNVGQILVPDISVPKATWGGSNTTAFVVGPGDTFVPLTFTLQNTGSEGLFNVNANLVLAKPFDPINSGTTQMITITDTNYPPVGLTSNSSIVVPSKNYFIGRMSIGGNMFPTYYVSISKDAEPGIYLAFLVVNFSNGNDVRTKTFEIPISISKTGLQITSIIQKPTSVYPGDVGDRITAQIFNAGLSDNNVYAYLQLPPGISPSYGNSTTAQVGRINTFQTVPVTFSVNVDGNATEGTYPIDIVLKTDKETVSFPLSFVVFQKANFKLLSVDDSQISPGATTVPFRINLENTGSSVAQTVTTKLLSGNALTGVKSSTLTSVGNQENIGTILPQQSFATSFMVNVDPSLSGDQVTTLEIDWTQNNTGSFVQTIQIPYHSGNSFMSAGGIPWGYVGIGLATAVGISVFASKRQKRRQHMESKPSIYKIDMEQPRDESDHEKKDEWKGV